jgi:hypothetical protein
MPGSPNVKKIVVTSGGTLVNQVIYPYPCIVHAIHVAHASGSAGWIQLHNSATVPADGAVPLVSHAVAANSDADIEGDGYPFYFDAGVYICESDTVPTKTLTTPSDLFISMMIEETTTP